MGKYKIEGNKLYRTEDNVEINLSNGAEIRLDSDLFFRGPIVGARYTILNNLFMYSTNGDWLAGRYITEPNKDRKKFEFWKNKERIVGIITVYDPHKEL